jgi:hypothetical protein
MTNEMTSPCRSSRRQPPKQWKWLSWLSMKKLGVRSWWKGHSAQKFPRGPRLISIPLAATTSANG